MTAPDRESTGEARSDPADAVIVALQAEIAALRPRLARLEAALDDRPFSGNRSDAAPHSEIDRLKAELASRDERLAGLEAAAEQRIAALGETLASLEQSVSWRATAPLRTAVAMVPTPVRSAAFRIFRGVYWVLTPHRMASRFRWMVDSPILQRSVRRIASLSDETRVRLGTPLRRAYGPNPVEQLDIFPASSPANSPAAPIFVFVHGGAWREGHARDYAFPAEMFVKAGAHYVALDFMEKMEAGGDLRGMVEQVRRGIAWVYNNAESFGGDRERLYIGGHSSGAHLAGVVMVTDWQGQFGLPPDTVKGGLLMSGMYDMTQIRRSMDYAFLGGSEETDVELSPRHRLEHLEVPLTITFGTEDGPEFQQHTRDLAAAVRAAGKQVELIAADNFGHMEMLELLANPYGPNGRAALAMMRLPPV